MVEKQTRAEFVLEAASCAPVPFGADLRSWVEGSAAVGSAWIAEAIDPFRRWMGVPTDAGRRRPAIVFYELFLGRGEAGAEALLDSFVATYRDPMHEARRCIDAALHIVRLARGAGLIDYDLNKWVPEPDETQPILVHLPKPLHAKLKATAEEMRSSMTAISLVALEEHLARLDSRTTATA